MKQRSRLLLHPLRNGKYTLVYTVSSRNGLMFKHLPGIIPFGEREKEIAIQHQGLAAFTFMQVRYSPYPY